MARMVERLKRHTGCHGTIANDSNDFAVYSRPLGRDGHAQRRAQRGAGVPYAERVIGTFHPAGKSGNTVFAAQSPHAHTAFGQNLMRIGLMAYIPDQPIFRRVEGIVQGDSQFHRAEVGGEMATGFSDTLNQEFTQLMRQSRQAVLR